MHAVLNFTQFSLIDIFSILNDSQNLLLCWTLRLFVVVFTRDLSGWKNLPNAHIRFNFSPHKFWCLFPNFEYFFLLTLRLCLLQKLGLFLVHEAIFFLLFFSLPILYLLFCRCYHMKFIIHGLVWNENVGWSYTWWEKSVKFWVCFFAFAFIPDSQIRHKIDFRFWNEVKTFFFLALKTFTLKRWKEVSKRILIVSRRATSSQICVTRQVKRCDGKNNFSYKFSNALRHKSPHS